MQGQYSDGGTGAGRGVWFRRRRQSGMKAGGGKMAADWGGMAGSTGGWRGHLDLLGGNIWVSIVTAQLRESRKQVLMPGAQE